MGGLTDQILREMVDATVENHFKKEKELQGKGIKVLSIFFIDRVANYREYDDSGNTVQGKFAEWFEESYTKWQNMPAYRGLLSSKLRRDGYFSQDKAVNTDTKETRTTKADDTFNLIMREKERLLMKSTTPLYFQSPALREGLGNQMYFNMYLNETKSDIKKRQEIGRGLRMC